MSIDSGTYSSTPARRRAGVEKTATRDDLWGGGLRLDNHRAGVATSKSARTADSHTADPYRIRRQDSWQYPESPETPIPLNPRKACLAAPLAGRVSKRAGRARRLNNGPAAPDPVRKGKHLFDGFVTRNLHPSQGDLGTMDLSRFPG